MTFYIIAVISALIVLAITFGASRREGINKGLIVLGVSGAIAAVALFLGSGMLYLMFSPERVWYKGNLVQKPIVSMKSAESIEGRFTLGTGYFSGVRRYYFMQDLGDGYYDESWVNVSVCQIRESSEHKPMFSYRWYTLKAPTWLLPEWLPWHEDKKSAFLLTVPEGSIIKEFRP